MKKSHDHTHLKRLAAISLVVVMCLSALPMLAPSASANDVGGRGYICIQFDNGFASDYEIAFPLMMAAGIPGTSFVISGEVGKPGYMTAEQLLEMEAAGWEIGSHTVSHPSLTQLSIEDATYELTQSKADLEALGLTIDTFAFPHGADNEALRNIADDIYALQRDIRPSGNYPIYYTYSNTDVRFHHAENPRTFQRLTEIVTEAIATDGVAMIYWHNITEDGIIWDSVRYPEGIPYTIQEAVAYLRTMMDAYGLQPIQYRDLMDFKADKIVKWIGDEDGLASDGDNWDIGTAPPAGSYLLFPAGSTTKCTMDANANYAGILLAEDYKGTVTIPEGVTITLGNGGILIQGGYINGAGTVISAGHIQRDGGSISGIHIQMVKDGTFVYTGGQVKSLRISADAKIIGNQTLSPNTSGAYVPLVVDKGAHLTIPEHYSIYVPDTGRHPAVQNQGMIDGAGRITFTVRSADRPFAPGHMDCIVTLRNSDSITNYRTLTMSGDAVIGTLEVYSTKFAVELNLDGHRLDLSNGVIVGENGIIGNGTVHTPSWTSLHGAIADDTSVILRDGGTVKLAPGQSFNALYIASEDGRTASWTMTATGAQSPIVYGLRPGSVHTWYLDGVEQGEIEADENGTIALSYESTGLHTLSVGPTPMTEAMDGLAAAIGIIVALAVLGGLFTMLGKAFGRLKF